MKVSYETVLSLLQLLVLIVTLVAFYFNRRKDLEERIIRQNDLDNAITQLTKTIERLDLVFENQAREMSQIKLTVELLLQQHRMNHCQQLNGGAGF